MKNFARLRFRFLQTRARADQSFQTEHCRDRQIATCFVQRVSIFRSLSFATPFELSQLTREVAISKTAFGDLAHRSKRSVSIEQIQQRRVSGAKLTDERIGRALSRVVRCVPDPGAVRERRQRNRRCRAPRRPARPVICCSSEADNGRQPLAVRASAPVSTTLRAGKSTPAATVAVAKIASSNPALISFSITSFHAGM